MVFADDCEELLGRSRCIGVDFRLAPGLHFGAERLEGGLEIPHPGPVPVCGERWSAVKHAVTQIEFVGNLVGNDVAARLGFLLVE
jgi:hypothetical protein